MYTLYYLILFVFQANENVVDCDDLPHEELDVHKSGNNDDNLWHVVM
jgi:hypothetical protein